MSSVGDALSGGGSSASGISDTTLSDASLGDQLAGGSGDFGTGDASAFSDAGGGGNSFSSFNDIANAFSGGSAGVGATPTAVQSASMTPPAAAGQTGGDPTGAAGGTQSSTTPGSTPTDQSQQQGGGGKTQTQDPNYAPPQAVSQLKALLKQLNTGKPPGPTGPTPQGGQAAPFALPTLAAGQTGPQSARFGPGFAGSQPGGAGDIRTMLPSGASDPNFDPATGLWGSTPANASIPPGAAAQPARQAERTSADGAPAVDAQGNPVTAAGTPAADTPLPPSRPGAQTADAGGGARDITLHPRAGAGPARVTTPPGTADKSVPTKKTAAAPAPAPAAQGPATSSIMRDISGVSTGSPTALADLAQAAKVIAPLIPLFAGLFGGGGRRGGRFHGGRFTHGFGGGLSGFRGGMNAMGLHGGRHPMAPGAWPYHHPQMGWHMHPRHPGPGWLPLNPMDAQGIVGGGGQQQGQPNQQGGPDPNNPPQETGGDGQPDDTFTQSGYGSNPFVGALVGQESGGQNIVSKTDKDSQGRTLAQGGNPNEISQGYFQIQNHPGGTWATYARQAGVDLSHYPTPRSAPLDVQWNVASRIPIGQWGHDTKAMLHQRFGQFDERLTLEQVASRSGRASGRLADAMPQASNRQSQWANNPNINVGPTTLPVASQPMVAGP